MVGDGVTLCSGSWWLRAVTAGGGGVAAQSLFIIMLSGRQRDIGSPCSLVSLPLPAVLL